MIISVKDENDEPAHIEVQDLLDLAFGPGKWTFVAQGEHPAPDHELIDLAQY